MLLSPPPQQFCTSHGDGDSGGPQGWGAEGRALVVVLGPAQRDDLVGLSFGMLSLPPPRAVPRFLFVYCMFDL